MSLPHAPVLSTFFFPPVLVGLPHVRNLPVLLLLPRRHHSHHHPLLNPEWQWNNKIQRKGLFRGGINVIVLSGCIEKIVACLPRRC